MAETVLCLYNASLAGRPPKPPPLSLKADTLLRPEGYREWVFVGTSTGLNYMIEGEMEEDPAARSVRDHEVELRE
jgi:hypothetical protein